MSKDNQENPLMDMDNHFDKNNYDRYENLASQFGYGDDELYDDFEKIDRSTKKVKQNKDWWNPLLLVLNPLQYSCYEKN